jgi:hypothetical protein
LSHIGIGNVPQRTLWKGITSNGEPSPDECCGQLLPLECAQRKSSTGLSVLRDFSADRQTAGGKVKPKVTKRPHSPAPRLRSPTVPNRPQEGTGICGFLNQDGSVNRSLNTLKCSKEANGGSVVDCGSGSDGVYSTHFPVSDIAANIAGQATYEFNRLRVPQKKKCCRCFLAGWQRVSCPPLHRKWIRPGDDMVRETTWLGKGKGKLKLAAAFRG